MDKKKEAISFDDFVQLVRRYTLTPTIIELSRMSYHFEKKSMVIAEMEFDVPGMVKSKVIVSQFALAFLSSQSIISSNDYRGKWPSYNDILILCNRYNNLETKIDNNGSLLEFLVRMSQEQIPFQEIGQYHFARGYYLFNDISKRDGYSKSLDLCSLFKEWCGLDIEEYYWIAWCINSAGLAGEPLFNKEYFLNGKVKEFASILTSEKLDKFLEKTSVWGIIKRIPKVIKVELRGKF